MSDFILIQTVCRAYQQTAKTDIELNGVHIHHRIYIGLKAEQFFHYGQLSIQAFCADIEDSD